MERTANWRRKWSSGVLLGSRIHGDTALGAHPGLIAPSQSSIVLISGCSGR